jgi:hypothetical protein
MTSTPWPPAPWPPAPGSCVPSKTSFYGDRSGKLEDPFGHQWHVQTHKEDMSAEEMQRRFAALAG